MSDPNEQFFASFGSAVYGSMQAPMIGAGRSNPVLLVQAWGQDLNRLGNPRYVNTAGSTGVWNSSLSTATRNFQSDRGLGVDGIVGPNTRTAMTEARGEQGQRQSRTDMALANLTPADLASAPSPIGPSPVVSTESGDEGAALAATTPFLEQEAWAGGPPKSKVLGIGAAVVGILGVVGALITMRPSADPSMQPALGMANRRR
jgi:peptidoglycan hydrolase-like protein with peptidoglycan-binding domain